jgi:hypothetical protein
VQRPNRFDDDNIVVYDPTHVSAKKAKKSADHGRLLNARDVCKALNGIKCAVLVELDDPTEEPYWESGTLRRVRPTKDLVDITLEANGITSEMPDQPLSTLISAGLVRFHEPDGWAHTVKQSKDQEKKSRPTTATKTNKSQAGAPSGTKKKAPRATGDDSSSSFVSGGQFSDGENAADGDDSSSSSSSDDEAQTLAQVREVKEGIHADLASCNITCRDK